MTQSSDNDFNRQTERQIVTIYYNDLQGTIILYGIALCDVSISLFGRVSCFVTLLFGYFLFIFVFVFGKINVNQSLF